MGELVIPETSLGALCSMKGIRLCVNFDVEDCIDGDQQWCHVSVTVYERPKLNQPLFC